MPDSTAIAPGSAQAEPTSDPRRVIRGSRPPHPPTLLAFPSGPLAPRFDWYSATIVEDPLILVQVLCAELGGSAEVVSPKQGYTAAQAITRDGSRIATVFYGGRNGHPHAFASSDATPAFVEVVRRCWPNHRVTRMDVALDFDQPGAFDTLLQIVRSLRDDQALAYSMAGAWDDGGNSEAGRTFYLGSRKSAVFARLYEKGKELRTHELPEGVEPSLDLTRLELVVRPDGDARHVAAIGHPVEAFGYAVWAMDLLNRIGGADVERVHIRQPRRSDLDRAIQAMSTQYAKHIAEYSDEVGGAEALGLELLRRARVHLARKEQS
jgi:DNA relaxase NicK